MKPKLSHVDLQKAVEQLLRMTGWSFLHVRKSIGRRGGARAWQTTTNVSGWADLSPCWNPRQPGRFLAIEIKVPPDKLSPEQAAVMAELAASGFECLVVTEADLEDLAKVLTPGGSAPAGSALSSGDSTMKGPAA